MSTCAHKLYRAQSKLCFQLECDPLLLGNGSLHPNSMLCDVPNQSVGIENGIGCYNGTTTGSTAFYQCLNCHSDFNDSVRTCLEDGSWNGSIPQCNCELVINCIFHECKTCSFRWWISPVSRNVHHYRSSNSLCNNFNSADSNVYVGLDQEKKLKTGECKSPHLWRSGCITYTRELEHCNEYEQKCCLWFCSRTLSKVKHVYILVASSCCWCSIYKRFCKSSDSSFCQLTHLWL